MIGAALGGDGNAEPLIGFRGFSVELNENLQNFKGTIEDLKKLRILTLRSTRNRSCIYEPGFEATAECDLRSHLGPVASKLFFKLGRHPAPDPDCNCGLYAYYSPNQEFLGIIPAIVMAWGPTHFHKTGWRSKNMKLLAFMGDREDPLYKVLGQIYDVPVIPKNEALAWASEQGHVVTPEERTEWLNEFQTEYRRGAIRSGVLLALWMVLWMSTFASSFLVNPVPIYYIVIALYVYWNAPVKVTKHVRNVISYRERHLQQ